MDGNHQWPAWEEKDKDKEKDKDMDMDMDKKRKEVETLYMSTLNDLSRIISSWLPLCPHFFCILSGLDPWSYGESSRQSASFQPMQSINVMADFSNQVFWT